MNINAKIDPVQAEAIKVNFGSEAYIRGGYQIGPGTSSVDRFNDNKVISAQIVTVEGEKGPQAILFQQHPFQNAALLVSKPVSVAEVEQLAQKFSGSANAATLRNVATSLNALAADPAAQAGLRQVTRPAANYTSVCGSFDAH